MKKLFPSILALALCMMMVFLSVTPTMALAAGSCSRPSTKISRFVTKSYTIASSWPFYAKDQFTLQLDKAGNIVDCNVTPLKRDCRPFITLQNMKTKVVGNYKNYVIVESTWTISTGLEGLSISVKGIKVGIPGFSVDLVTRTYRYRVWKSGYVQLLKKF